MRTTPSEGTIHKWPAILALVIFVLAFTQGIALRAADDFGDISVSPNAIYTGNTFHGYAEIRVVLENRSLSKKHSVTLVYPDNPYGSYGNCISRVSRTVSLGPEAREVVSLLQPPLPVRGDGTIRVGVDGRDEGTVRAPNANNHCNYYSRSGGQLPAILVSRALDFDAVGKVFQAGHGGFTAAMAVGAPDSTGSGMQPNAWTPETRYYSGHTNWIELDYAKPQKVFQVVVYETQSPVTAGSVTLLDHSGKVVATLPMASGRISYSGPNPRAEFSISETADPVKSVRLTFDRTPPFRISVDAVEIAGSSGRQWASGARASSDNSAAGYRYRPGATSADDVESLRAESPVSDWSENWLAYSPFDAVILSDADLAGMSPPVFAALGDYVRAGGNIVILGKTALPSSWHTDDQISLNDGMKYDVGFGEVFALMSGNPSDLNAPTIDQMRSAVRDTERYFQGLPDDSVAANSFLPVVENLKIPTRGIVIIMLAFILIIGPVNIFYLSRMNRRTWMLWTIPAISFATTLLVFAYSLLREGITPTTRIGGITVLDQVSHQAATIGAEAFYCPLTPSGGLQFDYGTEVTPLVPVGYGSGSARQVDWTQSQHLSQGWIAARVPVHFHLRKPETRRERVQIINENGKMEVLNSLGASIQLLWLADGDGKVYQANNVPAGEKAGLILSNDAGPMQKLGASRLLSDITFAGHTDSLRSSGPTYLLRNTYIAVLDGNPFIENALGSASSPRRTKSSDVVFGILEPAPKP